MLQSIPPAALLHVWGAIRADLREAIDQDPKRDGLEVLGQAIAGQMQFWRTDGGHVATQVTRDGAKRTFWVIYAGGIGGSLADKRAVMALLEHEARKARCGDLRFEGRDWRKVFPDFSARKGPDGRFRFRKVL